MGVSRKSIVIALTVLPLLPGFSVSPAFAQSTQAPSINPMRHFMFHAPGASEETALADYRFCAEQALPVLSLNDMIGNNKGILGNYMGGKDRRDMRAAVMRRCMHAHGYDRYAMKPDAWDAIVGKGDMAVVDDGLNEPALQKFAALAASARPGEERLAP
jgi:hypothetical protein